MNFKVLLFVGWAGLFAGSVYLYETQKLPQTGGNVVGMLLALKGDVQFRDPSTSGWYGATPKQNFANGSTVATGSRSRARITLSTGRTLDLAPDSQVILSQEEKGDRNQFLVNVLKGSLKVSQAKSPQATGQTQESLLKPKRAEESKEFLIQAGATALKVSEDTGNIKVDQRADGKPSFKVDAGTALLVKKIEPEQAALTGGEKTSELAPGTTRAADSPTESTPIALVVTPDPNASAEIAAEFAPEALPVPEAAEQLNIDTNPTRHPAVQATHVGPVIKLVTPPASPVTVAKAGVTPSPAPQNKVEIDNSWALAALEKTAQKLALSSPSPETVLWHKRSLLSGRVPPLTVKAALRGQEKASGTWRPLMRSIALADNSPIVGKPTNGGDAYAFVLSPSDLKQIARGTGGSATMGDLKLKLQLGVEPPAEITKSPIFSEAPFGFRVRSIEDLPEGPYTLEVSSPQWKTEENETWISQRPPVLTEGPVYRFQVSSKRVLNHLFALVGKSSGFSIQPGTVRGAKGIRFVAANSIVTTVESRGGRFDVPGFAKMVGADLAYEGEEGDWTSPERFRERVKSSMPAHEWYVLHQGELSRIDATLLKNFPKVTDFVTSQSDAGFVSPIKVLYHAKESP